MPKPEFYADEEGCHCLCDSEKDAQALAKETNGEALGETVFIEGAANVAALKRKGYAVTAEEADDYAETDDDFEPAFV